MENQDGVGDASRCIAPGRAEGAVVDSQFRENFAGLKMEIAEGVIAGLGCGIIRGGQESGGDPQEEEADQNDRARAASDFMLFHWQEIPLWTRRVKGLIFRRQFNLSRK